MAVLHPTHPLRRLFAGLTEQTFITELGIGDPPLIDYLAEMLARFLHVDQLYRLRDARGRRLHEVGEMLLQAEGLPAGGRTAREVYRHIGDFTLFWTGIFPEHLERQRTGWERDCFVDYCVQGKRCYYLASTYVEEPYEEESAVLRRLSDDFELCAFGLRQVRREWEQAQSQQLPELRRLIH
ncbi:MAG: hypothetical protein NZM31_02975 [Gemmatales bacterium]|nr:hypothetical protein [Gemmatales bacterium]MDW8385963.1 hypothetical protein [Gemmatales bacterium]